MLNSFVMNGLLWNVRFTNPNNPILVDRTNTFTCAVTDPATMTIYLADNLRGAFLNRVLLHELGHVTMFSYGFVDDIHRMCKKAYWIEAEEWVCNFLANYSGMIISVAKDIMGDRFLWVMPYAMNQLSA